jgi:hypothetical protein
MTQAMPIYNGLRCEPNRLVKCLLIVMKTEGKEEISKIKRVDCCIEMLDWPGSRKTAEVISVQR